MQQQELMPVGEQQIARPEPTFLEVIAAAARDPHVDVAKMTELLALKERIEAREAEKAFTAAMNRVQSSVPVITKNRKIIVKGALRSKYAALEDIDKVIRPLIIAEGFSLFYSTEDAPKGTKLVLTVKHRLGHKEDFDLTLPIDKSDFRSEVQNVASTVSFGRRLLVCMAFNIITFDSDLDGNPPAEFITEDQALTIFTLLKDCGVGVDDERFLAFAGADQVSHIHKGAYERVVAMLQKKKAGK